MSNRTPIFDTKEIKAFAETLPHVKRVTVVPSQFDETTVSVCAWLSTGTRFFITGFEGEGDTEGRVLSERYGHHPDRCEVPMIELTDGVDMSGGWTTAEREDGDVYVALRTYLAGQGFQVVPTMHDYF